MQAETIIKGFLSEKTKPCPCTGKEKPVVHIYAPGFHSLPPHIVVEVNGEHFYLYEDIVGEQCLTKQVHAVDNGGNIIRTRNAPESLNGILWGYRGQLRTVSGEVEYMIELKQ